MSSLQAFGLVVSVGVLLGMWSLLRRRRLREKYAALWILVGVGQLVLALVPSLLNTAARWLGIADPPNLLTFGAVVFLLAVCAHLSWESSRLEEETRTLAEEVAILRHDVEQLRAGLPERGVPGYPLPAADEG